MEIRKINGIRPEDAAAVDRAFDGIEPCRIACCNWAEEYPYAPEVTFRMFHTGDYLMLRFDVAERYTAARVTEDNGRVWTDSCVEFFIAPDQGLYYNFETTCIGRSAPANRAPRPSTPHPRRWVGSCGARRCPANPLPSARATTAGMWYWPSRPVRSSATGSRTGAASRPA